MVKLNIELLMATMIRQVAAEKIDIAQESVRVRTVTSETSYQRNSPLPFVLHGPPSEELRPCSILQRLRSNTSTLRRRYSNIEITTSNSEKLILYRMQSNHSELFGFPASTVEVEEEEDDDDESLHGFEDWGVSGRISEIVVPEPAHPPPRRSDNG